MDTEFDTEESTSLSMMVRSGRDRKVSAQNILGFGVQNNAVVLHFYGKKSVMPRAERTKPVAGILH
jgi:hypothetical protein